jgi:glycerol-3-phosphate dehydrogenase
VWWRAGIARVVVSASRDGDVQMWVFEEKIGDKKLTDIINTEHENVKYLPGAKFTPNLVAGVVVCCTLGLAAGVCVYDDDARRHVRVRAVSDVAEAVRGATCLVMCLPHQVRAVCGVAGRCSRDSPSHCVAAAAAAAAAAACLPACLPACLLLCSSSAVS